MSFGLLKGYLLTALAVVVLTAGAVLVIGNAENHGAFHLYVRNIIDVNMAVLMLLSAAGGVVVVWIFRVLIAGIKGIRVGRRKAAMDQLLSGAAAKPSGSDAPPGGGAA